MTPKKHKPGKTALKEEEEKPQIAFDLAEELKLEKTEELGKIGKTENKEQRKEDKPSREEKIKQNIDKVKAKEGVIGYIHRNAKSASIDLKDPAKIIDYAVLSTSAFEASEELSNTFNLGNIKHIVVEGNTAKLLSFTVEENKVSVFLEKNVDHNRIYKDLRS